MSYLSSRILTELQDLKTHFGLTLTHPFPSLLVRPVKGSKSPVYAVYRVITALVLSGLLIAILHDDFFYSRLSIPLETMLMHYGYWSFLLLTVDFLLQAASCVVYQLWLSVPKDPETALTDGGGGGHRYQRQRRRSMLTRMGLGGHAQRKFLQKHRNRGGSGGKTVHHQPWIIPPFYRVFWFFHNVSLVSTPVSFGMFITRLYEGRMYAFRLSNALQLKAEFHWIGFALILVDFFVSGVPVRLLHFYQPLTFALLYNVALLIFTLVTRRQGPFYRVADYFSHDTDMKLVSMAYFMAFSLFVPLASHMIVYGLHQLRVYLFERVHIGGDAAAKELQQRRQKPASELYDTVHATMRQKARSSPSVTISVPTVSRSALPPSVAGSGSTMAVPPGREYTRQRRPTQTNVLNFARGDDDGAGGGVGGVRLRRSMFNIGEENKEPPKRRVCPHGSATGAPLTGDCSPPKSNATLTTDVRSRWQSSSMTME